MLCNALELTVAALVLDVLLLRACAVVLVFAGLVAVIGEEKINYRVYEYYN